MPTWAGFPSREVGDSVTGRGVQYLIPKARSIDVVDAASMTREIGDSSGFRGSLT